MCQGGQPAHQPRPPLRRTADEALCPAASAVAAAPILLASDPVLPLPPGLLAARVIAAPPPPARRPAGLPDAAYPRGPPTLA